MKRVVILCAATILFLLAHCAAARTRVSAETPNSPNSRAAIPAAPDEADDSATNDDDDKKDASSDDKKSDADKESVDSEKKDTEKKTDASSDDKSADKEKKSADEKKDKSDEKAAAKSDDKKETSADADKEKPAAKADEKTADKAEAKKRKTLKIEPKRLKIDVSLDGTFVADKMTEVTFRPEAWTDYEIVDVIEQGKKVHKGETLFKFDSEKLNEAIADLELEQRLSELTILKTEEELPRLEKTLKLDFDGAERANKQAKEDYDRYREVDRPMMEKTANFMVKFYNFQLAYEKDELDQLEKMYKADDLTEETEEIVLKRQRSSVEFAEFSLEDVKISRDETLKYTLPRYDIRIKENLDRSAMAEARARTSLNLDLNRARFELEQRKQARTKSLDRHGKLLQDRDLMEIKSPADGAVFYGQCVNGRWSDTASLITKYKPKNNVSPNSVLMTIVDMRPLYVASTIEEGKRPDVSDGQNAKVASPAADAERIAAEVKSISPLPVGAGKFEINFSLTQDQIPDWVVPGMSCKIQLTIYNKKDAIVVPKTAVHDDEEDDDKKYVWLINPDDEDAKPERRDVKLGKRKDNDVEIIKGLKAGDVISLDDEDKKDDKEKPADATTKKP